MGLKGDLKMSHSEFCSGGPGSRHSFKDTESLLGLADTLYTILILVVSADSRVTGLCGRYNSFPFSSVLVSLTFLIIPSFVCLWINTSWTYSTELTFLISYVMYQDYSLYYYVMKDDFLSRYGWFHSFQQNPDLTVLWITRKQTFYFSHIFLWCLNYISPSYIRFHSHAKTS